MITSIQIIVSILGGLLPALLWLWFWLKEDSLHPEPRGLIFVTFLGGMLVIPMAMYLESLVYDNFGQQNITYVFWAVIEELLKFLAVFVILFNSKNNDEPIDSVMYLITAALGFAALENSLFLFKSISQDTFTTAMISVNLRFMGATLLHTISSAAIGVFLAISFYKSKIAKVLYFFIGFILASALHTFFNLSIININEQNTFYIFSSVWLSVIILLFLFERVKSIYPDQKNKDVPQTETIRVLEMYERETYIKSANKTY